jgi:glutamate synthase (ferredoxin)
MFAVDLKTGELLYNWDIKKKVASELPYGEWLKKHRVTIREDKGFIDEVKMDEGETLQMQTAFGYTEEDIKVIIETMAEEGNEATFSMGEDTPLAFIS